MIRNIIAVVAGYLSIAVLTLFTFFGIDWFFPNAFPEPDGFPNLVWALFILAFSFIYAVAGGYVTAWLAEDRKSPIAALAIILLIMACASIFLSQTPQPLWYETTMLILGVSGVLLGAVLHVRILQRHQQQHPLG